MLKIKDNMDLKELEKFGFKYKKNDFCNEYSYQPRLDCNVIVYETDFISSYDGYLIHPKRVILLNPSAFYCEDKEKQEKHFNSICYKLIQAGIVEKVSN